MNYKSIGHLKSVDQFRDYMSELGLGLPVDDAPLSASQGSPLAQPMRIGARTVGNRWAIQPMEGWDATPDGRPTEPMLHRWTHFGQSGAKLIWGGEAFAVRRDGRANPHQLYYAPENIAGVRRLFDTLVTAHRDRFGPQADGDLLVGLQLTHSGRFSCPNAQDRPEPRIAYHHPLLDRRLNIAPDNHDALLDDSQIEQLIQSYVDSARMAHHIGFHFVDIKCCHGYLGHELLSAFDRPGPFGGDFEGRTRFLRTIIREVRRHCPGLMIGVRLSAFDFLPFMPAPSHNGHGQLGPGIPEAFDLRNYPAFGCRRDNPLEPDLTEPIRLLKMLHEEWGVALVNLTAGSPYYNPHIQRPAFFPPSDGYQPPEDPLIGCARQIQVVRQIKRALPALPLVGSAYSYFQEYLPHVAQATVRNEWVDFIGIGRLTLSYWDLPADLLEGKPLKSKKFCRTFSDCTTAARNGLPSGCYPLDHYYKDGPSRQELRTVKLRLRV